jgi:dienelactone hydrolase
MRDASSLNAAQIRFFINQPEDSTMTDSVNADLAFEETLAYEDDAAGQAFRGLYVRHQSGAAPRAGLMVVPDWRGISPFVREQAQEFSHGGYDVAVVDLYGSGLYAQDESQASSLLKGLIDHRASGVARMRACLAAFRNRLGPSPKVIVLGYSVGGMVSLDFGRVLCSALLKTAAEGEPSRIGVPVLALHGSMDVVCPGSMVYELTAEMDRASNDFRIVLYGRTHHAFYNPQVGTDPSARLVYSEQSDKASKEEIVRFIERSSVA